MELSVNPLKIISIQRNHNYRWYKKKNKQAIKISDLHLVAGDT